MTTEQHAILTKIAHARRVRGQFEPGNATYVQLTHVISTLITRFNAQVAQ